MKTWSVVLAMAVLVNVRLFGQGVPAYPAQAPEQIDELVSPIALYPDPLVSVILPASTVWPELQSADQLLRRRVDWATVDAQPWDDSVKALVQYPQVVDWMVDNLQWTQSLGATFIEQPGEVMNSIQRLRANARAQGILVDTPQQRVIVQGSYVAIEPAQREVIYVPIYDPEIIYARRGYAPRRGTVSFSSGLAFGTRPPYEVDWNRRALWVDRSRRDYSRGPATTVVVRPQREEWRPRREMMAEERAVRAPATVQIVRPRAFPSAPVPATRVPAPVQPPNERLTPTGRMTNERAPEVINRSREPVATPPTPPPMPRVEPRTVPPQPEGRDARRGPAQVVPQPPVAVPTPPIPLPPVPGLSTPRDGRVSAPPLPDPRFGNRRENPGRAQGEARRLEQGQPPPQPNQPPAPLQKDQAKDDERREAAK